MSLQQGPLDLTGLAGSVCVCTGAANGGIGFGILQVAAEHGMHLCCIDLHQSVVTAAVARLQGSLPGVQVVGITCDVTKPADCRRAAASVAASFGGARVGGVFANAGVLFPEPGKSVLRSKLADWQTTFDVNVFGVLNTIQAFVPMLQESKLPSVVCTTASIGSCAFDAHAVSRVCPRVRACVRACVQDRWHFCAFSACASLRS